MSQISFADAEYAGKRKKTRREVFLEEKEQVMTPRQRGSVGLSLRLSRFLCPTQRQPASLADLLRHSLRSEREQGMPSIVRPEQHVQFAAV